jgi:trk system potassium uptake protein TrkA
MKTLLCQRKLKLSGILLKEKIKKIMIIGGGNIGYYLAKKLTKRKYKVKIIENNKKRADLIAELLPNSTIIYGDGTKHDLLLEEGIEAMDAFIPLTGIDEENIIAAMYANKQKVKKIITKTNREELFYILEEVGIQNNVSPKDIVASNVIRYIRALANSLGSNVITLYRLVNNQVEALEFIAKTEENFYDIPLKDVKLKDNCLIACIIRNNEVIIPDGNSCIKLNDNVIVVTTHKNFDDLADIFE